MIPNVAGFTHCVHCFIFSWSKEKIKLPLWLYMCVCVIHSAHYDFLFCKTQSWMKLNKLNRKRNAKLQYFPLTFSSSSSPSVIKITRWEFGIDHSNYPEGIRFMNFPFLCLKQQIIKRRLFLFNNNWIYKMLSTVIPNHFVSKMAMASNYNQK